MIDVVVSMVGKSDLFENFNWKRYEDDVDGNKEGDILLWYDRPQILYLTYCNKNYTLTLYDDFKMEENWVDIFIVEDVTGLSKKSVHDQLFNITNIRSVPMFGVIINKDRVIDYIEIL